MLQESNARYAEAAAQLGMPLNAKSAESLLRSAIAAALAEALCKTRPVETALA